MRPNRCAAGCGQHQHVHRRDFLATSASLASASLLGGSLLDGGPAWADKMEPQGPAAKCVPVVRACFVRRKGDYGMRWPGAVYDGEAARKKYTDQISAEAKKLNLKLELRPEPVYSAGEADQWIAESQAAKPDGLLVVLLDRQEHAWPTANKAIDTKIPTVIFSPVGSSRPTRPGRRRSPAASSARPTTSTRSATA